jgi:hypothetical protein
MIEIPQSVIRRRRNAENVGVLTDADNPARQGRTNSSPVLADGSTKSGN